MLIRVTGFAKTGATANGYSVEYRHWKDVVDEFDNELEAAASSEEEQAIVDLWLEDPMSFQTEDVVPTGQPTGQRTGGMIRRADNFGRKQAVVRDTNWDQEFADAKAHVASVLGKLGNGR